MPALESGSSLRMDGWFCNGQSASGSIPGCEESVPLAAPMLINHRRDPRVLSSVKFANCFSRFRSFSIAPMPAVQYQAQFGDPTSGVVDCEVRVLNSELLCSPSDGLILCGLSTHGRRSVVLGPRMFPLALNPFALCGDAAFRSLPTHSPCRGGL
jgi:hypothetical protein